jgi:hypothetical protein
MTRFVRSGIRRAVLLCSAFLLAVTGAVAFVSVAEGTNPTGPSPLGPGTVAPPTFGGYSAAPNDIDHFGCYASSNISTALAPVPVFKIPPAVELANQFSPPGFFVPVGKLVWHCNPTQKTDSAGNVTPIVNPLTHMTCFVLPLALPATTAVNSLPPPFTVTYSNQFGTGTLTTGAPRLLCLPTLKNLQTPVPISQPAGLDHYVCYSVLRPNTPTPPPVTLQDQFNTAASPPSTTPVTLLPPNFFCVPSLKNPINSTVGAVPNQLFHPEAHLVCYPTKELTSPTAPGGSVVDQNQFGLGQVKINRLVELCVPSFKSLPTPQNTLVISKYAGDPATGVALPLSGATFTATPTVAGNPSGSCTTDASGTCSITGLAIDTYNVSETTPPPGYAPGADQSATFTFSPQTINLVFNDQPITTGDNTITVTKLSNPNSTGGGAPLAGAVFTAVGANPLSPTGSCTTTLPTGSCVIGGLANDTYTVSETVAPPGFSPGPPQVVVLPPNAFLTFFDNPAPTGATNTIVVRKTGTTASGKIVPLGGAKFTATPSLAINPSGSCTTTLPTGTCSITGLAIDTYTVTETVAPPGWVPALPQNFTFLFAPQTKVLGFMDTLPGAPA